MSYRVTEENSSEMTLLSSTDQVNLFLSSLQEISLGILGLRQPYLFILISSDSIKQGVGKLECLK